MKEVKTWKYCLTLYVGMVIIDMLYTTYLVLGGERILPYGWVGEIPAIMITCIADFVIAFIISMAIDPLLRIVFDKTFWANIVLSIILYKVVYYLIKAFYLAD